VLNLTQDNKLTSQTETALYDTE